MQSLGFWFVIRDINYFHNPVRIRSSVEAIVPRFLPKWYHPSIVLFQNQTSGRLAAKRWSSVMYFLGVILFLIIFGKGTGF
jgi:hypothetical protein